MHLRKHSQTERSDPLMFCNKTQATYFGSGQWDLAIPEISNQSLYQKFSKEIFPFFNTKLSNSPENTYLEHSLYHCCTDFVESSNTLIQKSHSHTETSIAVKASRRKQKIEVQLTNGEYYPAFLSTDMGHIF